MTELPKDFDPSVPLDNIKWETFCLRLLGMQAVTIPNGADDSTRLRNIQAIPRDLRPVQVAQAYVDAGYSCKTETIAAIAGSRLLKNVRVGSRLQWLKSEEARILVERGCCGREEIAMTLSEMFRARFTDFMQLNEDGKWMNAIGPETLNAAALKKIKTKIQTSECKGTEVTTERQFDDIELESKVAIGNALAKLLGFNEPDKAEHKFTGPVTIITNIPEPDPLPDHLKPENQTEEEDE